MLDEFIVLGLVPGTRLQITFDTWLVILSSLASILLLWRSYRTELLQRLVIVGGVVVFTHRRMPELIV
jgi:hypothetical protein